MTTTKPWTHEDFFNKMVNAAAKIQLTDYKNDCIRYRLRVEQVVLACRYSDDGQVVPILNGKRDQLIRLQIVLPEERKFLPPELRNETGHHQDFGDRTSYFIFDSNWPDWLLCLAFDIATYSWVCTHGMDLDEAQRYKSMKICRHSLQAFETTRAHQILLHFGGTEFVKRVRLAIENSPKIEYKNKRILNVHPSYRELIIQSLPTTLTLDQKKWFNGVLNHVFVLMFFGAENFVRVISKDDHFDCPKACRL